ncbi:copper chaperone [Maritimibacter sp. 55A14]|uniref:heavy-metal-associated domain-containing protein n=1 Tax=Maritimibacter sp. 55A14 TaxID=2174844 RepID=UPI000D60448C|nr:heavy-metal-associated domain-containing protein [Maritimibacter sp. 55A14]PWE28806.1 copper chaperone [Maritimibacter sp. 55A14]
MTRFHVPEMSCGHCTAAIGKAINAADPAARIDCDLNARIVSVESALDTATIILAMKEAGYDATPVEAA